MSERPSQVTFRDQPCLELRLDNGDRALIALQGAQVLSWTTASGQERLYLSPKAVFDGRTAIRGGIPICFPQFNQRVLNGIALPKHGFARMLPWSVGAGTSAQATLSLNEGALSPDLRRLWPHLFQARLTVRLLPGSLKVHFEVCNTGQTPWPFALALHTYLHVHEIAATTVKGLQSGTFWDAVSDPATPDALKVQSEQELKFDKETDRVYKNTHGPLRLTQYKLTTQDQNPTSHSQEEQALLISQDAGFSETVVWNPGAALCANLSDMPSEGYRNMLCVEAARIDAPVMLAPGQTWLAWQSLTLAN